MMQTMPYNLQGKGVVELSSISIPPISKWKSTTTNNLDKFQQHQAEEIQQHQSNNNNKNNKSISDPNTTPRATSSVDSEHTSTTLDTSTPGGPPTSTSTLSSAACATTKHDWLPDDVAAAATASAPGGLEEWDSMFPNGEGALLPWIMGEADDMGLGLKHLLQSANPVVDYEANAGHPGVVVDQGSGFDPNLGFSPSSSGLILNGLLANPNSGGLIMNPLQTQPLTNPTTFLTPSLGFNYHHQQLDQQLFQPQPKRQNTGNPFGGTDPGLQYPSSLHIHQQVQLQEQGVKDQLYKAADLIQTGNFSLAQEILARLNHHLSSSFTAKPLFRAALYIKEALQSLLLMSNPVTVSGLPPSKNILTPYDVVHKMSAYKAFSEVSPVTQFVNFTSTQAILEAIDDVDAIHVIDFDLGCGAQWASLIQELPLRKRGAPSLKITAVSPISTSDPFEISLVRENLIQFANDIGVSCELHVVNFDLFDPLSSSSSMSSIRSSNDEAVAVSIPIWATSVRPSILPAILRFIKSKSPKIVVSFDRGFDRFDVPFPQHLLHTLESCANFLDSMEGLRVASDTMNKFERFFIQPRVENAVMGRVHAPDKMPHWKTLFASAGFSPVQLSNFAETQADYVVKRTPGRGFHVEKRQASLVLSWHRREIMAASAWKC